MLKRATSYKETALGILPRNKLIKFVYSSESSQNLNYQNLTNEKK